jgi:hypothetical protein
MAMMRKAPKILLTNPEGKRSLGRLRYRWRIIPEKKKGLKQIWHKTGEKWWALVKTVMSLLKQLRVCSMNLPRLVQDHFFFLNNQ